MSLVSTVSRVGPSVSRILSRSALPQAPGSVDTVRRKSKQAKAPPPVSKPGYMKKDKEIEKKRRQSFPHFRSLPQAQLKHDIFTGVQDLELPAFRSVARKKHAIGKPVEITAADNDPLRIFGLPKNLLLEFRLLSKPYTVIRKVTNDVLDVLERAKQHSSTEARYVFTGRPGAGKSFLLLQAVEHAIQSNWIVIYIPRAVDLVNATTSHIYDIRTQTYLQATFSFQTLQRMLTVNAPAFERLSLPEDLVLEKQVIPAKTSLAKVINVAIDEKKKSGSLAAAPAILEGVMRALDSQVDYPVLLAVDQFQALYGKSWYRDQHFARIQPYHLSMPRLIMEYASGRRAFSRGAVLGAICATQSTNPMPIELRDALEFDETDTRVITEYDKRSPTMMEYTRGLKSFPVPDKLTLEEAVGVFEIWKGRKVFGTEKTFYDETFLGKYTESGGNPREFVWNGLLSNFEP